MNPGLLSGTNSNCLSIFYEAYRIGLCIFQCDQCDRKVDLCRFRNFFVVCDYIGKQLIIDLELISALFKCNTKYLLVLDRSRYIIRIDLDHIIISVFLCL